MTDPVVSQLAYVPGSAAATYSTVTSDTTNVYWTGTASTSQSVSVTFRATRNSGVSAGQLITNTVQVVPASGAVAYASNIITEVLPILSTSAMGVSAATVTPGNVVTYAITVTNTGTGDAVEARVTDTLPVSVTSASAVSPGSASISRGVLTWSGAVTAGQAVNITVRATLRPSDRER